MPTIKIAGLITLTIILVHTGGSSIAPVVTTAQPIEPTTAPKPTLPTDVRLPLNLEPLLYDISLRPYLEGGSDGAKQFTFDGSVKVTLAVSKETSMIILHIRDIKVNETSVIVKDSSNAVVSHGIIEYDLDREFIKVPTTKPLSEGAKYTISMEYTGYLNDLLVGFYRSSYTRADGTKQYLATTHFQPTDARRAFPCMDEPGFKSKFLIRIKCLKKYTAISNTNVEKIIDPVPTNPTLKETVFKVTPKMSTYLIAFVVSDFTYKESKTQNNVTVRVWARKDAITTTDYALDAGVKVLDKFDKFFKEKFPLEKQDMIAIPDFNAGAMENWGLVTYRETALLYDEKKSSISNMQRVAEVVSHELAHQWFGNLVTPKWWNDLWLNEGFASFVENIGIDTVEPTLKIMQQIVTKKLQPTLAADSIASSHPISVEVNHPSQIAELFDSISYGKGASVIRMMDFFLTRGYLQNGLQEYLQTFKYGNTKSDDLWAALTKAVKNTKRQVDVKTVMDTWTLQMGFPVVTITKMADRAVASQKRFLLDGKSDPNESPFGYKWEIPLTYTTEKSANWDSKTSNIEWMHKDGADKMFTGLDANSWIIGNIEQMGYYRVNYDADNWGKITMQLNNQHQEINVKNRAQILDDAFNLARADLLHYKTAFKLTKYMENENEYTPWDAAMNGLAFVRNILSQTSSYGKYMKYMKKIGLNKYNSLAAKFDSSNDSNPLDETYLRATIVNLMCGSGHEDCLTKSTTQLRKWMTDSNTDPDMENPIDLNLRSQIYCYGIEAGDADIWDFMWEKYKAETVAAEKKRIMLSLACTKEPWILKNLLKMSIEKKDIRKQDGASVIQAVASKEVGNPFAWNFIRTNWDYLVINYGQSMSFARVILAVSSSFSDEWKLYELESFMKAHEGQLGSATRGFNQAVEKTKGNIKWIEDNLKEVGQWLEDNST